MPELPEIEILSIQLQKKISGLTISGVLVFQDVLLPLPASALQEKLSGKKILSLARRGKFLKIKCEHEVALWFHLGMTGQLLWSSQAACDQHVHLALQFEGTSGRLVFRDIRKFGQIHLTNGSLKSLPAGISQLGPEPFQISGEEFIKLFSNRTGRIKSLLLNQRLLAGLGNIYADESLFLAGIDPRRRPFRIKRSRLFRLHQAICETLKSAIEKGGSSIDDYLHLDGGKGSFQKFHQVYGREGEACVRCEGLIRRVVLSGRSSHFCPECQR